MSPERASFVHEAQLRLGPGTDPAAVGALVTIELCGAVEHRDPCRWPHNNAICARADGSEFGTLFVAAPSEADEVHRRIGAALRRSSAWTVEFERLGAVREDEAALTGRLAATSA